MATALNTIKNWFRTGKKPTQDQFWAVFESFWHKDGEIPVNKVENLTEYLDAKAEKGVIDDHYTNENAHADLFNDKVDKIDGKGLSTYDFDLTAKQAVDNNSDNKQIEITDAIGDFVLTDEHFRATFFINTTGLVNCTIPTATLKNNFVCFFHVVGTGQLNIQTDGGGVILNAVDGTLLSETGRGMLEKMLNLGKFYASGDWEA